MENSLKTRGKREKGKAGMEKNGGGGAWGERKKNEKTEDANIGGRGGTGTQLDSEKNCRGKVGRGLDLSRDPIPTGWKKILENRSKGGKTERGGENMGLWEKRGREFQKTKQIASKKSEWEKGDQVQTLRRGTPKKGEKRKRNYGDG